MKMAVMNGVIGLALCLVLGIEFFEFSPGDALLCVLVSNIAAFISILLTLKAEKITWLAKRFLNHTLKTWALLVLCYLAILLGAVPLLRDIRTLTYLFIPLVLSTGFAIIVFGPIQDQLVSRSQRKNKTR
jgi:hypothetical protein